MININLSFEVKIFEVIMTHSTPVIQHTVYYRLIALWAVCEAFAGGVLHAFKIPFTGMVINSMSVICIVLIAKYHRARMAILQATVIVAVFKMMLSPHSPPTAYIALFFQGLLGQLLFASGRVWLFSTVMLATCTLVESAIQRILVLVIVYGNEFWQAMDVFITRLTGQRSADSYSFYLAVAYVGVHALTGILVGSYAHHLVHSMEQKRNVLQPYLTTVQPSVEAQVSPIKKKKRRWWLMVLWFFLLFMFIQSALQPQRAILASSDVLKIILRAALIILSWYLFISPLLKRWMHHLLQKQKVRMAHQVALVQSLIPEMKQLFIHSWRVTADKSGFARIRLSIHILLVHLLYE